MKTSRQQTRYLHALRKPYAILAVIFLTGFSHGIGALDFINWSNYVTPEGASSQIFTLKTKPESDCTESVRLIYEETIGWEVQVIDRNNLQELCETAIHRYDDSSGEDVLLGIVYLGPDLFEGHYFDVTFETHLAVELPDRFLQGQVIGDATTATVSEYDQGALLERTEGLAYVREVAVFNDHETLAVPYGTLSDCIKRRDVTKHQVFGGWEKETSIRWYCNGIGLAKEIVINSNGKEKLRELVHAE